jgi:DNA polymerase-3 subunit alpha
LYPCIVTVTFSLLDGLSKPPQIAERCKELGYHTCALTDHASLAGSIQFIKALKDVCKCGHQKGIHDNGHKCRQRKCKCTEYAKESIKPILGCEFYLSAQPMTIKDKTNRRLTHLVVLAKNLDGWKALIKASSESNKPEHIYYQPRLDLETLASFGKGNFITFSGHMGSDMAEVVFAEPKLAYQAKTYEEAKLLVRPDWKEAVIQKAGQYVELFGKENFYLEIQLIDHIHLPAAVIVAKILRWVGKQLNIPCVATCDAHYPRKEDAPDQRIELCSQFETTLLQVERKIIAGEDTTLAGFFRSNNYHIPSLQEMEALHESDELTNTVKIADTCENYDILGKPILPQFDCPNGIHPDNYIRELCREGWKSKIANYISKDKLDIYADRVKYELSVIQNAGLAPYFLIVQDYVNYARNVLKCLVGPGRGSGAGCLVSNLIGITNIDPIEYGLYFERFYNPGRNTKDRVSLPDIDSDFPKNMREKIISYVANKFGSDHVAQMITFHRMQGKSAIKDVFRAHQKGTFDELNRISEFIPDEAEINDQLQLMKEVHGEASIIRWALENNADGLRQWCFINDKDEIDGEYAPLFKQAIRLEGTKRQKSKHASGIIISPTRLADICPMVYDSKTKQAVAGWEMNDLEAAGLVKFDILGVAVLDKIMGVADLLSTGDINV